MKQNTKYYLMTFMTFILLTSLLPNSVSVQANESQSGEDEIENSTIEDNEILDNHLRIHFNNEDLDVSELRLWLYNDVLTWSEDEGIWPDGKSFPEGQMTDYGPYVDVELKEDPKSVEMIVIYEGKNLLDAIKIEIISEDMNEVWISREGEVSLYEPVDLEDNQIRIHYYAGDGNYEPWGIWTWGDFLVPSEDVDDWPIGAYALSNDQVGKFGAYIDLDLKEDAKNINFLFANREGEGEDDKFGEYYFNDMANHNQIFLREGDLSEVYTNPYHIKEKKEPIISQTKIPEWSKDSVIYEVNVKQYSEEGTFKAFQEHLPRLQDLGVDVLWFMPIYPISEEKKAGPLGSPYAVKNYTEVHPDLGTMEDFQELVNTAQDMGFHIVLDWVANHTGWDNPWIEEHPEWYLQNEDGEILHPQEFGWLDVAQLNYESEGLRQAMKDAMLFWVEEIGIDGFRADYASGVPTDFWEDISAELNEIKTVFMLAEDNRAYDLLNNAFHVNWGWDLHHIMNDIAVGKKSKVDVKTYFEKAKELYPVGTYPMQFITSHDENAWEGTIQERLGDAADAMAALYFTVPGIPMIYSGQEAGLNVRLPLFDKAEIDWSDLSKQVLYKDLVQLKKSNEALWNGSAGGDIQFLETSDDRVLAFEREMNGNKVLVIINLSADAVSATVNAGSSAGEYKSHFSNTEFTLEENQAFDLGAWDYQVLVQGEIENDPGQEETPESEIEKELQGLKDQINDLTNRIEEIENNTDIKDLEKQVQELEQKLTDFAKRYQGQENSISELEEMLNDLKQEVQYLKEVQSDSSNVVEETEDSVPSTGDGSNTGKDLTPKEELENNQNSEKAGKELPKTATSTFNLLMIGIGILVLGGAIYGVYSYRRKKIV